MKRILSLDGGGIRGAFSLEILARMEALLRERAGSPSLVLADHFDLIAGTSTGAIIATCLSWGMSVADIQRLYIDEAETIFRRVSWASPIKRLLMARYEAGPLSDMLRRIFSEDGKGATPALLGSPRLRTLLVVVVRNHTTGSAWPLTNNPRAKYNEPGIPGCNLEIPLWKIVRASAAAPVFFPPEDIEIGGRRFVFVDGGITPYNNPALIAARMAVLPEYRVGWQKGPDDLRLVSVGTIRMTSAAFGKRAEDMWLGYHAAQIPMALLEAISLEQDYMCRCLGRCLHGEPLDSEVGDLVDRGSRARDGQWFSYVRYNQSFLGDEAQTLLASGTRLDMLDAIDALPRLCELGRDYAAQHVTLEHLG